MLPTSIPKNDKIAKWLIAVVSGIIFLGIVALDRNIFQPVWPFNFDVHLLAGINAVINSIVFIFLVLAIVAVKLQKYQLHKRLMLFAILLSVFFLVSYSIHHLYAGDTKYGGTGVWRFVYFFILITHIFLAAIIMPFVLFTAYKGLSGAYKSHKKIARWTWPIWSYVSLTGVLVYLFISPYYT